MSIFSQIFGGGFDSNSVEPQQDYDVLPPGKYSVVIEKAEVKGTKKGDGHYIEVCCSVSDGPCKNRKLWSRMNINNPSEVAQRIGQSQLAGLCKACGIGVITDENQLLGKTCVANVKVKDEQNEIRSWSACGGVLPAPVTPSPLPGGSYVVPPTTAPAAPTGNKPPWMR